MRTASGEGGIGTGATASHAFTSPGSYPVTLTVTDGCGFTDTQVVTVEVSYPEYFDDKPAMSTSIEYTSFLVRMWRPTGLDGEGNPFDWQSEVEYIQSGQTWAFDTLEALRAFMRQQMEYPEKMVQLEILPDTQQRR